MEWTLKRQGNSLPPDNSLISTIERRMNHGSGEIKSKREFRGSTWPSRPSESETRSTTWSWRCTRLRVSALILEQPRGSCRIEVSSKNRVKVLPLIPRKRRKTREGRIDRNWPSSGMQESVLLSHARIIGDNSCNFYRKSRTVQLPVWSRQEKKTFAEYLEILISGHIIVYI